MTKIHESSRPATSILDFSSSAIESFLYNKLSQHKVDAAYLFGSCVQDKATAWSDIDLVIVMQTDAPFLERAREFADLFELGLPIDILVYTPQEFKQLQPSDSGFWESFRTNHKKILPQSP